MTWTVQWTRQARDDLRRLEPSIQKRVIRAVHRSLHDPSRVWRRLRGGHGYRLRVGAYRVLGDLDHENHDVQVLAVGHRRNAYDR